MHIYMHNIIFRGGPPRFREERGGERGGECSHLHAAVPRHLILVRVDRDLVRKKEKKRKKKRKGKKKREGKEREGKGLWPKRKKANDTAHASAWVPPHR